MTDKTPRELADENSALREELGRWHTLFPDMTSLGGDLVAVADAARQLADDNTALRDEINRWRSVFVDAMRQSADDKAALIDALEHAVELIDGMNDLINEISGTRSFGAKMAQEKYRAVLARVKGDKP